MAVCLSGSLGVWKFSRKPLASHQDHCFPALLPFSLCLIDCATVNATPNTFELPPRFSWGRPPVKCGGDSLLTHPKLGLRWTAVSPEISGSPPSPPHTSRLCQWCRAELTVALPVCAVTVLGSLHPASFQHLSSAAVEAGHCGLTDRSSLQCRCAFWGPRFRV